MVNLDSIDTPALVMDRARFIANCQNMIATCRKRGTRLRPHMKTLKSIDAARYAIDPEHGGIAVATLNEAEYFAEHGLSDIQLAVCLPPNKLDRAAALLAKAPGFSFFIDDLDAARAVAAHDAPFNVWIEVDCGEHRTGVWELDQMLVLAQTVSGRSSVRLQGLATHGGHSYRYDKPDDIAKVAEAERMAIITAASFLRSAGFSELGTSAGSTPTAVYGTSARGIDEVRAGVYMAGDLFQAEIGCLGEDEIATSVLATVISRDLSSGRVIVDAGGLALSKDRSTAATGRDRGYGAICDRHGIPIGDLFIREVHQEHGEFECHDVELLSRLSVGTLLRVVPNHICMTAAMYDEIIVLEGDRISESWPRTNGWSRRP